MEHDSGFEIRECGLTERNLLKHSEYGLASFMLFLAGLCVFFGWVVFKGVVASSNSANQDVPVILLVFVEGIFLMLTEPLILVSVVGICLAFVGLFQKNRKKLFAILGLVFNGIGLAVSIGMMMLPWLFIK